MPLFPAAVVLNVSNIERAAKFWSQAIGYVRDKDAPAFLVPPVGEGVRLHLDEEDRTHLDLWADHGSSDLETEVDRLVAIGAQRVDWVYPDGADFVVLSDTEGNLFCVIEQAA